VESRILTTKSIEHTNKIGATGRLLLLEKFFVVLNPFLLPFICMCKGKRGESNENYFYNNSE
jgi:hypothetical protein